jgi:hypothetical protein
VTRDAAKVLRYEGAAMAVLTKHVHAGKGFVWVIAASRIDRPPSWIVADAFRLYGDHEQLEAWAADPLGAFAEALERFGIDFRSTETGRTVRFSPFIRVPADGGGVQLGVMTDALGIDPARRFHIAQSLRVTADGEAQMAFAYFVDDALYASATRAASRGR